MQPTFHRYNLVNSERFPVLEPEHLTQVVANIPCDCATLNVHIPAPCTDSTEKEDGQSFHLSLPSQRLTRSTGWRLPGVPPPLDLLDCGVPIPRGDMALKGVADLERELIVDIAAAALSSRQPQPAGLCS